MIVIVLRLLETRKLFYDPTVDERYPRYVKLVKLLISATLYVCHVITLHLGLFNALPAK